VITLDEAIGIARAEGERRGWPIRAELGTANRVFLHVVHGALRDHDGCVVVRISKRTGRVANFILSFECYATPEGIVRAIQPCPHPKAGPGGRAR